MSETETPTKPTKTEEPPKSQVQSRYETIRVPILRPSEYAIWKVRMTMFLEATDPEYLDRIKEGPHKPTKLTVAVAGEAAKSVPKEKSDYTAEDIASIDKDAKSPFSRHGERAVNLLGMMIDLDSDMCLMKHKSEAFEKFKEYKHATFLEKEFILEGNSRSKIELDEVQEAQTTTDRVETPVLTEQPFVEQPIHRSGRVSHQPERVDTHNNIADPLTKLLYESHFDRHKDKMVELLVSLLLPADAKKGEKVIKSKCKPIKTLKGKDDEKDDHGNSGMGGGHGQGKGFSSSKAGTTSQRTSSDTGRRISSYTGLDFESLKEEEARLKLEKVNSKSEVSVVEKNIPKAKGIVIKERINHEATKAKSQMEIDPRSKGKEKVGEPVKVYVPAMDEEIFVEDVNLTLISKKISQTTSDMAQVVQSQDIVSSDMTLKQATSDIAQVGLISEDKLKETSDIPHVKSSKLLLPGFTKAKQTQPLKTAASGFEARVITGKEARDKSGLGSADERRVLNTTNDPISLNESGVGATPERLNQLEAVQMVYHTFLKEHIMLYFRTDGRVYHIRENAIPLKYFEELEHVRFLLQVKNRLIESAANYLKTQIQSQKKLYSVKSDSTYCPKYRDHKGDIVEMKPNSTKIITTFLGYKAVEFNLESDKTYLIRLDQDIRKAKINDLRTAIFQIGEDIVELKNAKRRMIDKLKYAERCLLKNYLKITPDIKEISN
ncbi:hypothetical protein AgCh_038965 [Apium graveolens]